MPRTTIALRWAPGWQPGGPSARAAASQEAAPVRHPSPDGTRLVFERDFIGPSTYGVCQEAIFTVNVDGSDLRLGVPPGQPHADLHPSWSPHGSLVFNAEGETRTRDGRNVSLRFPANYEGRGDLWIMDADGEMRGDLRLQFPQ